MSLSSLSLLDTANNLSPGSQSHAKSAHSFPQQANKPREKARTTTRESRLPSLPALPTTSEAENTLARTKEAIYGPRSSPLFFTGLHQPPLTLAWEARPGAVSYRVHFGCILPGEGIRWQKVEKDPSERCVWSLESQQLQPEAFYLWRIETLGAEPMGRSIPLEDTTTEETRVLWRQEGCFWLLDTKTRERFEEGQRILASPKDVSMGRMALALFLAEIGLYQNALRLFQQSSEPLNHAPLSHTIQALIYQQMGQNLHNIQSQKENANFLPDCLSHFARAREEYHRQKAASLPAHAGTEKLLRTNTAVSMRTLRHTE